MTPATVRSPFHEGTRNAILMNIADADLVRNLGEYAHVPRAELMINPNGEVEWPASLADNEEVSGSSANCSGDMDPTPTTKQEHKIMANATALPHAPATPSPWLEMTRTIPLIGNGYDAGFRNDPEGDLSVRVRTAPNGQPRIETGIDSATSGLEDVAFLTLTEAILFANTILEVARHAVGNPSEQEAGQARQSRQERIQQAQQSISALFDRHDITDPEQAKRLIRERFSQVEYDIYTAARDYLDGQTVIG